MSEQQAKEFFSNLDDDVQIAILEMAYFSLKRYKIVWSEHLDLSDDILSNLRDELRDFLFSLEQ